MKVAFDLKFAPKTAVLVRVGELEVGRPNYFTKGTIIRSLRKSNDPQAYFVVRESLIGDKTRTIDVTYPQDVLILPNEIGEHDRMLREE